MHWSNVISENVNPFIKIIEVNVSDNPGNPVTCMHVGIVLWTHIGINKQMENFNTFTQIARAFNSTQYNNHEYNLNSIGLKFSSIINKWQ